MNKTKGNMYNWITHTWNPIKGKCSHDCEYCYMKRFKLGELRLDEKDLKNNLGTGNKIFVGSSTDMFADAVPKEWIERVLEKCRENQNNEYVFQTKNPKRFMDFDGHYPFSYPSSSWFGTTIETNRKINISKAPPTNERLQWLKDFTTHKLRYRSFVSMEPIMDFDAGFILDWMKQLRPEFVSIGADSKNHGLSEPPAWKILLLIYRLKWFTEVRLKNNLNRLVSLELARKNNEKKNRTK